MLKKTAIFGLALSAGTVAVAQFQNVNFGDLDGAGVVNWAPPTTYVLQDIIYVENGTELNIAPGTIIRGQPRDDGADLDPGTLVVTATGTINAVGNAANPIVYTSAGLQQDLNLDGVADRCVNCDGTDAAPFVDPNPISDPLGDPSGANLAPQGDNGGLILLGLAPTNNASISFGGASGTATIGVNAIEGLPDINIDFAGVADSSNFYGGLIPNDSNGAIAYWSIRFGGSLLNGENEINGLTMGGVGYGTRIDHIEIFGNSDDGFEWFGGTVNASNLVAAFVQDDHFDMDEGYTGVLQFLLALEDGNTGDQGMELDGDHEVDGDGTALPNALPATSATMFNVSMLLDLNATDGDYVLNMDDGFGALIANSIFIGKDFGALAKDEPTQTNNTFAAVGGRLQVLGNTFFGQTTVADPAGFVSHITSNNNTTVDPAIGTYDFDFTAYPGSLVGTPVNPRPANTLSGFLANTRLGQLNGIAIDETSTFLEDVNFVGAFDPSAAVRLWTSGWTVLNTASNQLLVD